MPMQSPVVSLRVSPSERDLLDAAAEQTRTSLSDFIRRSALQAAELTLLDDRRVTILAADWDKFEAWANAPARDIPALRALADSRPVWRD
jgi:uncharacterized protein (DUF1778 family)